MPQTEAPALEAADARPAAHETAEEEPPLDLRQQLRKLRRENRISAENLDALHADTVIAGDNIGGASHRATDGGTVYAAGRDLYIESPHGGSPARTVPLPARHVTALRRCHVATDSFRALVTRLREEHVLLLRGEPHSGRTSTAVVALAHWAGDDHRLAWLQPGEDPFLLTGDDLRDATGYLLQAEEDWTWRRTDQVLGHLHVIAERTRSRIVVLVDLTFPLHEWCVEHRPPEPEQVFTRWLIHELRKSGEARPRERAEKAAIHPLVHEKLAGYDRPQQARELAAHVAEGFRHGRSLDEILDGLPEQRQQKARALLAMERPRRARCFLIATSVLRGSAAAIVATQAVRLSTLIEQELARQTTTKQPPEPHVWESLSEWAHQAGIDLLPGDRDGDGQLVDFPNRHMAGSVLRVVWEEQPTIHEPLLAWLSELTEHPDHDIRMKAAQAIGVLATYDFPAIRRRFLDAWANSDASKRRNLAAWTLASAANDPKVIRRVFAVLRAWASGNRNARSVVIKAYGSWLGVYQIDEALKVLMSIARTPAKYFPEQVAASISQIHQLAETTRRWRFVGDDDPSEHSRKIIAALARWSADENPQLRRTAALAFVRLLASPEGARLTALAADPHASADLVALWRHTLDQGCAHDTTPAATPEAWGLLGEWLALWEADAGVRSVVTEILTRPPSRLRAPLLFHLRLWHRAGRLDAGLLARLATLIEGS